MFQVNKSAMSMCVWEACKVPFSGFRSHTNNGTLFYVDGEVAPQSATARPSFLTC